MQLMFHSPKDTLAGAVALTAVLAIIVNALFLQAGRHPSPLFATVLPAPERFASQGLRPSSSRRRSRQRLRRRRQPVRCRVRVRQKPKCGPVIRWAISCARPTPRRAGRDRAGRVRAASPGSDPAAGSVREG